ncbi:hypothetical protein PHMEG_00019942 [Phytophthora megakarya]|uniref:Uncharacterized protein n=1 Tax=Phytophthora megakarya TaxID=4795 RepID=A0A225VQD6_9STRA|nr:hypothetical protein PHMEG_00019942 [Phytophthora megakarya]
MPSVSVGVHGGIGCGCVDHCTVVDWLNAKESRFCTDKNCSFGGVCENTVQESTSLILARSCLTGIHGVVANKAISASINIGDYLGHLENFRVSVAYATYPLTVSYGSCLWFVCRCE